jgi:raffinose/stachyose/melibiose transport system permease protein
LAETSTSVEGRHPSPSSGGPPAGSPPPGRSVRRTSRAGSPPGSPSRARLRRRLGRLALYLFAFAVMALIVLPLSFSILGGFRSNQQLVDRPVGLPDPWVLETYRSLLTSGTFWRQVLNSTVIALLTTVFVLPAASLSAFVLARYDFRGRELIYGLFTLGLLFPVAVAILPLFIVLRQIGLLSNPLGVALPQAAFGLPVAIIIMRPFFRAIPQSLQDAARIDGCGPFRFFWYVMLPLSRPVLSTIAVITVVGSWNAFLLPLLVLIDPNQHTLPIGVNNISSQFATDYAVVLAYTTLSMIPALLFYALAERQIIGGLTNGAVKE